LPENIKADKIDARYENGELMIYLPKQVIEHKVSTLKNIEIK
jgi:HSP20 family molecular chaperone IbpA